MLAVRLSDEIQARLTRLSKETGRPKSYYVREAIAAHLDDMDDRYLAAQRLIDVRAGRSQPVDLAEVGRRLGLGG